MRNCFACHYYNTSPRGFVDSESSTNILLEKLRVISRMHSSEYKSHDEVARLPMDDHIFDTCKEMAVRYYTSQLKFVVVIGIGGSNLGTKALYDAIRGQHDLLTDVFPKIIFLDTVSPSLIKDLTLILKGKIHHKEEILINLVSKSGTTTESIVNFEILINSLSQSIENIEQRVVCTTDENSKLWEHSLGRKYGLLAIPKLVGGRYSVFSSVGLFPLLLVGIDVVSFREGAKDMLLTCLDADPGNQHARRSAEILFGEMMNGANILNLFHFNPEFESLGKWERQLVAESLGKEKDLMGKIVHAGITPIVSVGSTDLHSMAQLYFGGPRDKFTMLIHAKQELSNTVPADTILNNLVSGISDKSPNEIMDAIYQGVMSAYRKNSLPFAEVRLNELSPYSIGAYMEWRMLTVIHLAALMHVDPYDQPNVEDYKTGTREILQHDKK